jgi:predicted AAA+ superfamily ATPase
LREAEPGIDKFLGSIPETAADDYFKTGGFPFQAGLKDELKAYEGVKNVITGIVAKDIASVKKFKTQVLSKIYDLIYLLASSDTVSYDKLLSALNIGNYRTLDSLMESLELCGIISRIKSYGRAYHSTRKTPKFLFLSPCIRAAVLDGFITDKITGKRLEDYFCLLYNSDLKTKAGSMLYYDSSEAGADFIMRDNERGPMIIETGFNKEDGGQIMNTAKRVKNSWRNVIFGSKKLELTQENIFKIPLKFLLYM